MPRLVVEVKEGYSIVRISVPHGGLNQLWDFEGDGTIRSKLGLALTVNQNETSHGGIVFARTKRGWRDQKFRIVPVSR